MGSGPVGTEGSGKGTVAGKGTSKRAPHAPHSTINPINMGIHSLFFGALVVEAPFSRRHASWPFEAACRPGRDSVAVGVQDIAA